VGRKVGDMRREQKENEKVIRKDRQSEWIKELNRELCVRGKKDRKKGNQSKRKGNAKNNRPNPTKRRRQSSWQT